MTQPRYLQLRDDAQFIAKKASSLLAQYQNKAVTVVQKDNVDIATDADIASEKLIRDFIKNKYPDHSIFGEEGGLTNKESEFLWIVDPLDGTKEYARGVTEYNCLLAIEKRDQIVASVIKRNGIEEIYVSSLGDGAYMNGQKIHVSERNTLAESIIGFHLPIGTNGNKVVSQYTKLLARLINSSYRVRGAWDEAKFFGWVARGVLDAHVVCPNVNDWHDVASGLLLVTEAGGRISNLYGNQLTKHDMSKGILASNGNIHDQLLAIINN